MKLWRQVKRHIRRRWKQRHAENGKHYQPQATPTGSYQVNASGAVSYQPGPAQVAGGKLPPPDGAMANCRRCSNEVQYNGNRERWEHTGRGNAECFQRG